MLLILASLSAGDPAKLEQYPFPFHFVASRLSVRSCRAREVPIVATSTPRRMSEPRRVVSVCPHAGVDLRSTLARLRATGARPCAQRTFRLGSRHPIAEIFSSRPSSPWDRERDRPRVFSAVDGTTGRCCRGYR